MLYVLKKLKPKLKKDKRIIKFFLIAISIIYVLDFANGSTKINTKLTQTFYDGNIASLTSKPLLDFIINVNVTVKEPQLNKKQSVTFEVFKNDSSGNQLLILIESFGLLKNVNDKKNIEKIISENFKRNHWKIKWGITSFEGSTTRAELRELLNSSGDYKYYIHKKSINSIFDIKKKQGYNTIAAHSYNGSMFERNLWWKNLGINQMFFGETLQEKYAYKLSLNSESPFISIQDEFTFDFLQNESKKYSKCFSYLLTVNSHLPFNDNNFIGTNYKLPFGNNSGNLTEANAQMQRIISFLGYVAQELDSTRFQKVLIVGDHMPPFNAKNLRLLYENKYVPYCYVYK
ncbi:sulfatase-like hydrolase/transferase [Sediminibacterium sp. TEGAF015]|uniref:sulfatase-like hydrolase/transferase n=1 Tax=Sediminibacterium sp. TEGAF015 TaxID=575378 RepID=UPI00222EAB69|nr:sulfatase-like hydrolase/transferase [Sediminibacterium sp. TEGAF015]